MFHLSITVACGNIKSEPQVIEIVAGKEMSSLFTKTDIEVPTDLVNVNAYSLINYAVVENIKTEGYQLNRG
jgi:hypothetical protein